jgi:hypothetical protein
VGAKKVSSLIFTVTNVTHATYLYDAASSLKTVTLDKP